MKVSDLLLALSNYPDRQLMDIITKSVIERSKQLSPADGLRFLFNLEALIYPIEGVLSIAYDGGIHTKHRHTKYHDFFVDRISKGETILDIGCGNGALTYDIAEKSGAIVTGIDLNDNNISVAKEKYNRDQIKYICGNVLTDLPKGKFTTVVLSNVLEHLPERSDFLKKIKKVINPSRFLIRVPLFERDWRVPLKKELGVEWRLDLTHEIEYTLDSFKNEINDANLVIKYQEVRWSEIWAEIIDNE